MIIIQFAFMIIIALFTGEQLNSVEPANSPVNPETRADTNLTKSIIIPIAGLVDKLTLDIGDGVNMQLVKIPAGTFLMGSPETEKARSSDEGPQHEVVITRSFYMGIFPVTQGQYQKVMGENPSVAAYGPEYPVENIRWEMAIAFCKKMSEITGRKVRLPSEAEFEYATRAGTKTRYFYGDDSDYKLMDKYAWYYRNCKNDIKPVGQKQPNPWGLYDVYGIVWQWCSDWYADAYPAEKQTNPIGPETGEDKVLRGGAWLVGAHTMDDKIGRMLPRSALRGMTGNWYNWPAPGSISKVGREYTQVGRIGFRVVVEEN